MKKTFGLLLGISLAGLWCAQGLARAAGYARICFEAEYAREVEAPMKVVKKQSKEWSGSGYIEIPDKAGKHKGLATYTFTVSSPGYYYLWARTFWRDGCGNSVGAQIDNHSPVILGQDGTYQHWHWVQPKGARFKLSSGKHAFKLIGREDGIMVDEIFMTQDSEYVPEGIRPATQKPS